MTGSAIDKVVLNTNLTDFPDKNKKNYNDLIADYRLDLACCLTFLVGLIQLLMGILGIGRILSSYFSDTFISGYTCASAFHVVTSQIKELLGLKNVKKFDGIMKIPKVFNFIIFLKPFLISIIFLELL
jgi:MFS superfamily sulfate permease-like transporter